jgi:hypothetical protein
MKLSYRVLLGLLSLFAVGQSYSGELSVDLSYLEAQRKIHCSLEEGKEVVFIWHGRAYARVPGERDKHLFDLLGMNIRRCGLVEDDKRGAGFRLVSRELMFYLDPVSGEVLQQWDNPWTGKTVVVETVANDPVNLPPFYSQDRAGKALTFSPIVLNETWFSNMELPLFYPNPLGGSYQNYVGGYYHATEMFDFSGNVAEILDNGRDSVAANVAWIRIAQWLPWMEMGGRSGLMYFNATGAKLTNWDDLPQQLQQLVADDYPVYRHAPALNDARRNQSSWSAMKAKLDARRQGSSKAVTNTHAE